MTEAGEVRERAAVAGELCPFCSGQRHEGRCPSYTLRWPDRAGLLLVCADCEYAWEPDLLDPTDHGEAMSTGCPLCGGWTWIGELTEPSKSVGPRPAETHGAEPRRRPQP